MPKRHEGGILELQTLFEIEGGARPVTSVQVVSEDDFTSNLELITRVAMGHVALAVRNQRAESESEKESSHG